MASWLLVGLALLNVNIALNIRIIQVIPRNGEKAATTTPCSLFTTDLNRSACRCFFVPPVNTSNYVFHYIKTKHSFLINPKIWRSLFHRHVCFEDMSFTCDTTILQCLPTGNCSVSYDTTSVNVVHQFNKSVWWRCTNTGVVPRLKVDFRLQYFKESGSKGEEAWWDKMGACPAVH